MATEKGTPEKRVQMHDTPPQEVRLVWLNPAADDNPKVHLGDRVTFDALGRKALGTVTRWDDDGITIREEPPQPDAEQVKEFVEHTGLPLSGWQIDYLTGLLQKRHP